MPMMGIRHVRMRMEQRLMGMRMAVGACRHGVVRMVVVPIVVAMGVFMRHRLVRMRMPV